MIHRFALVAAALAVAVASPAAAFELRKDASGSIVRWREHATFTLDRRLAARMDEPGVEAAVRKALATVAAASNTVRLSVEVGDARGLGYETGPNAVNQNEITGLEDWPYQDGAIAATLVTLNGVTHELLDTDIAFNLEQHTFRVIGASNRKDDHDRTADDVQNTLTHELGHALGLMHNAADPTVVMYPGAVPGEIHKRVLAKDDAAGLAALYEQPAAPLVEGPAVGCSATPGASGFASWVAVLAVLGLGRSLGSRGRRTPAPVARGGRKVIAALIALAVPAVAFAEPKPLELTSAERVAVGEVVEARSSRPSQQPGLIVTDLTIRTHQCLKGGCDQEIVVRVPGGVVGELEQEVIDHPVPKVGAPLAVLKVQGRNRLALLGSEAAWEALRVAAVKARLPAVRSLAPRLGR